MARWWFHRMASVWSVCGFAVWFAVALGGELWEPRRGDDLRSGRLQDRIRARRPRVRSGIAELAPNWIFARHHQSWMLVHLGAGCLALRGQVADPGDPFDEFGRGAQGCGGAGTSIRSASSRPRCQGKVAARPLPVRGGCGWIPPGPRRTVTPSARRDSTLRRNGARSARAVLTKGRTTVGTPRPVLSARTPRA
jgi:hypothetical protein